MAWSKPVKGPRVIGGRTHNYDSAGEANLARVLEFQKQIEHIREWEREATFDFNKPDNDSPTRRNIIDFKVTELDGSVTYYEYKGSMDNKSYMRLKLTMQYYPETKIVVVIRSMPRGRTTKTKAAGMRILRLKRMGIEFRSAVEMYQGYKHAITGWE